MKILITGGSGFIGSALIRHIIANTEHSIVNVDWEYGLRKVISKIYKEYK